MPGTWPKSRHGVIPEEIEEICYGDPIVDEAREGRLRVIGRTRGRIFAAFLMPQDEEGVYYVVTARAAARKERRRYRELKGGEA